MRVLFMHHFPLGLSAAGHFVEQWAQALIAAGHEVRALIVDEQRRGSEQSPDSHQSRGIPPMMVDRIVCRAGDEAADLPFDVPQFSTSHVEPRRPLFRALSDEQLVSYRDQIRLHLDAQVHGFDTHIIHAQHIWVQGQLALESGVPYVVNAWGPELIDSQHDARYRGLATQTAENAGRIFVPDEALRMQVVETFETPAETTLLINAELQPDDSAGTIAAQGVGRLLAVYQAVLDERFGGRR